MYFSQNFSTDFRNKGEQITAKSIVGEKAQMNYVKLGVGKEVFQTHASERFGFIVSGAVEITIGNEIVVCSSHDAYYIPSNVKHAFKVLHEYDVELIEFICPPEVDKK